MTPACVVLVMYTTRYPLKIISWLLLNTGAAATQLGSLPCWHRHVITWRGQEMCVGETYLGISTWNVCPLGLSLQFCFPYIENKRAEKLSGQDILFCIPLKRKAWTHQSSALAVASGSVTAPGFGVGRMEGNGSSETGWGQCSAPVAVVPFPMFYVLASEQHKPFFVSRWAQTAPNAY